jgi:hypothetical protein
VIGEIQLIVCFHQKLKLLKTPELCKGFSDGESSFMVIITKDKDYKTGWQVQAKFDIGLHIKDKTLLYKIQAFFGVGNVTENLKNNTATFLLNL